MSLISFFKLVEIQTKVASVIPFTLGSLYALYRYDNFNIKNFLLMFVSLLCIDMATTAINNYMDYKKAIKKHGFNYESHNAVVRYNMKEFTVKLIIISLLLIGVIFGLILYLNTDIIILLLGIVSFGVGVLYSYGPLPISRTPLGEIFSGFFMGFIIVFISVYIHIYDTNIVSLLYKEGVVTFRIDFIEVLYIFFISIPLVSGISNIMLANNICDLEDDIENKRYTLPVYIGKEKALKVFKFLYYIVYIDFVLIALLRIVPLITLLSLTTFIPMNKNLKVFLNKQDKKETFIIAVKNFIVISIPFILILGISNIIDIFFTIN